MTDLLGKTWEILGAEHALELTRLMVKVETLHERQELLKILQVGFQVESHQNDIHLDYFSTPYVSVIDLIYHYFQLSIL